MNWQWLPAHLIPVTGAVAAIYNAYGDWVAVMTPQQIETAVQSGSLPAAPRSRAEMVSGLWTPDDALLLGQEQTLRDLANRNAAARANANAAVRNPVTPNPPEDDWTMYYVLGAVAVTGLFVAIVRK